MTSEVDLESLADGLSAEQPTIEQPRSSTSTSMSTVVELPSWLSQHRPTISFFGIWAGFLAMLFFVALGLVLSTHPGADLPAPIWHGYRLPDTYSPVSYNINITVDLRRLVMRGRETIRISVKKNTTFVVIHSAANVRVSLAFLAQVPTLTPRPGSAEPIERRFLAGEDVFATRKDGQKAGRVEVDEFFMAERIVYNAAMEHFVLQWRQLPDYVGKEVLIGLAFDTRLLSTVMKGAYVSSYQQGGLPKRLVATQFEATDARAAFPCFDEPHLKVFFVQQKKRKAYHLSVFSQYSIRLSLF